MSGGAVTRSVPKFSASPWCSWKYANFAETMRSYSEHLLQQQGLPVRPRLLVEILPHRRHGAIAMGRSSAENWRPLKMMENFSLQICLENIQRNGNVRNDYELNSVPSVLRERKMPAFRLFAKPCRYHNKWY